MWQDADRIAELIDELAADLARPSSQTWSQRPSDNEVASLRSGDLEARIAAVIRLNDKYRDGWHASSAIAGVAHYIHVSAVPCAPAVNVPMAADVLRMMGHGLTQAQAVYSLGGTN